MNMEIRGHTPEVEEDCSLTGKLDFLGYRGKSQGVSPTPQPP